MKREKERGFTGGNAEEEEGGMEKRRIKRETIRTGVGLQIHPRRGCVQKSVADETMPTGLVCKSLTRSRIQASDNSSSSAKNKCKL